MVPPLVPPDVIIPRLPWVPIYADRLWESNFFAVATDAEFRAAFCLWLKSWTQTPPGSLPTDDRILCRLAELGGDLPKWKKVKRIALRHWMRCDDGRLYHPVVAELVIDAATRLNAKRDRMAHARAARRNHNANNKANDKPLTETVTEQPPREAGRARVRAEAIFKNGKEGAAAPSAPLDPKILGHALPCACRNCTRWVAMQHKEQRIA